ncbi:MAG: ATP synthase F1 subunit gamma [bacterium]
MAALKDLKTRINSVKNTAQITKAMQMVSASKMQKAQEAALAAIPYANGIFQIVNEMGNKITEYQSPYLRKSKQLKNIAIVVIGTSRGFVGGALTNLTAAVHTLASQLASEHSGVKIHGISLHKTGQRILASCGIANDFHFAEFFGITNTTALTPIFSLLTEKFAVSAYDEIYLVYTHFINTIDQQAVTKKLLPLSLAEIMAEADQHQEKNAKKDFVFEPDINSILDHLLPEYFQTQIYTAVLEAAASEHSARMVAMKSATDNAIELEKELTLKYNRSRQSAITQEIIEVVSGSLS